MLANVGWKETIAWATRADFYILSKIRVEVSLSEEKNLNIKMNKFWNKRNLEKINKLKLFTIDNMERYFVSTIMEGE